MTVIKWRCSDCSWHPPVRCFLDEKATPPLLLEHPHTPAQPAFAA